MTYDEISKFVDAHREEAVKFLQNLLRIPSPTGDEKAVASYVVTFLTENGFDPWLEEIAENRPNVLCDWKGDKGKTLLFNGHLDVFPPEGEPARAPWSGEIEGDRIYARGATDMKSGVAAGILAMTYLKQLGFSPKGTLSLGLNCDEEQGGRAGILHCINKGLLKADFTICMEASEDTIIVDTDGRIAWKITFVTDSWHAGTRLQREDAIHLAHRAVSTIYAYDEKLLGERYFPDDQSGAVISVTSTSAGFEGKTVNMHPSVCTIWVDRRYTRGETIESVEKEFRAVLDAAGLSGKYKLETLFAGPRLDIDPKDKDIIACMNAWETVFQKKIRPGRRCGAGDAGKLAAAYNQKVPHFGPGIFEVLGTDDEHVLLSQYLGFIKVYMLFASQYLA